MTLKTLLKLLFIVAIPMSLSSCLTRRTVTSGGQTVESKYVFKRPVKEAVQNSR